MIAPNYSILLLFLCVSIIHGQPSQETQPPTIGNFANSKQPSTNFGFGQTVTSKNTSVLYFAFAQHKTHQHNFLTLSPEFAYGITDYLAFYCILPIIIKSTLDYPKGGVGDFLTQLEYAFYQRTTSRSVVQATIVANLTWPTAHISSMNTDVIAPLIGYGAVTFFIGATATYTSVNWFGYISPGVTIPTTSHNHTNFGASFLYQFGLGHNLGNPGGITLLGMLEFEGTFTQKTKTCGVHDNNSGGNVIFLGPSLYATHDMWEFWGGIQAPIVQNLNGIQDKAKFRTIFSIAVTF